MGFETNDIKPVRIKLPTDSNCIKLYILSDVHLGDQNCDVKTLKSIIDFIRDTENCYCILLGDLINTALKNSKSDIYSETCNVMEAQKQAVNWLTPIKDKILAIVPGNHENRAWREAGIDISLWIAGKLGLEDKYRNGLLVLDIMFGKDNNGKPFSLYVAGQHGAYGGGRKLGAAMNALEDLDGIVSNADVYIRAHTHQPIQGSRCVYSINEKGNIVKQVKYYFNSPSVMTFGGYAMEKGYKPTDDTPCYLNIRAVCSRVDSRLLKSFKIDKVAL